MNEHFYAVIMAGGGGTRLWPLSRRSHPKQMLRIGSERTLFQLAVDRLEGLIPPERILVVTVTDQAAALQKQYPEIPGENFVLEPMPRGTASVVGLAAVAIQNRDPNPDACMVVLTADHFIKNVSRFRNLLDAALMLALKDYLVTLGIEPSTPSSAYGYIEQGDDIGLVGGFNAYHVAKFTEKPSVSVAEKMLLQGGFSWNSGMFIWRVEQLMCKIRQFLPDLAGKLDKIALTWETSRGQKVLADLWPQIQKETIDYGIMEKSEQVAVLPAEDLGWYDVGSWDSLCEMFTPDGNGNIVLGADHIQMNTMNSLIVGEVTGKPVVTVGIRDLIIVDTGHALLVIPKSEAQRVRNLIDFLKENGREDLL